MNRQCLFCDCLFPDECEACPACKEPNPGWEKRNLERIMAQPMPADERRRWVDEPI